MGEREAAVESEVDVEVEVEVDVGSMQAPYLSQPEQRADVRAGAEGQPAKAPGGCLK